MAIGQQFQIDVSIDVSVDVSLFHLLYVYNEVLGPLAISVVVNKSIMLQSILILIGQYQSILSILSIIVQIASLVNNKPVINDTIIITKHY